MSEETEVTIPQEVAEALHQLSAALDPRHPGELREPLALLLCHVVAKILPSVLGPLLPKVFAAAFCVYDKKLAAHVGELVRAELANVPRSPLEVSITSLPPIERAPEAVKTELIFDTKGKVAGKIERVLDRGGD